jgi:hypothetical protein
VAEEDLEAGAPDHDVRNWRNAEESESSRIPQYYGDPSRSTGLEALYDLIEQYEGEDVPEEDSSGPAKKRSTGNTGLDVQTCAGTFTITAGLHMLARVTSRGGIRLK